MRELLTYRLASVLALAGAVLLTASVRTSAVSPPQDESSGFAKMLPSDITWLPTPPRVPGGTFAILLGDLRKPGPRVLRVRLPGGAKVMPHTHSVERTYTVLTGELKLGLGEAFDPTKLRTFPAGSVYRLPAHLAHFQEATGPGETILQIHYVGPAEEPGSKQR